MKKILLALTVILALSFTAKKFKMKNEKLVYIPSRYLVLNTDTIRIMSMYMTTGEVTNGEYKVFLDDLITQKRMKDYNVAKVDTLLWSSTLEYGKPYVSYYFNHPVYSTYPVVNISKQGAELYCEWYTKKMNSKYETKGHKFQRFRLPMKSEWIYAAKGGLKHSPYPWGGPYTRDSKGDYLANFAHVGDRNIKKDENGNFAIASKEEFQYSFDISNSQADILAPSLSYFPNGYGLYHMAGNANEMIADEDVVMGGDWRSGGFDIRVTSQKPLVNASPLTGFRMVSTYVPVR